jgi:hypothetical protein
MSADKNSHCAKEHETFSLLYLSDKNMLKKAKLTLGN